MKQICQCKALAELDLSNPNLYVADCPKCGKYYIHPNEVNAPIECEGEVLEVITDKYTAKVVTEGTPKVEFINEKPKPRPAQRR